MENYWSSAPGVVGNADEGSNAHVCLDSSAWCQQCSCIPLATSTSQLPGCPNFSGLGSAHYQLNKC